MTYKPAALFALLIGGVLGAFGCSRISNTVPPEISRRIVYGTKDGGGGKGVLCRGQLRTLDLYEADEVNHLLPAPTSGDLDTNLKVYAPKLTTYLSPTLIDAQDGPTQDRILASAQADVMAHFTDIDPRASLELTDDASLPVLRPGCSVVQIAAVVGDQIYRDKGLWDQLDIRNQTSLVLHEALRSYRMQLSGAITRRTTDETRRIIGLLMADQMPSALYQPLWNAPKVMECHGGRHGVSGVRTINEELNVFFAVDERRGSHLGVALYFGVLADHPVISRTSAFIAGMTLAQFSQSVFSTIVLNVTSEISAPPQRVRIEPAPDVQAGGYVVLQTSWGALEVIPVGDRSQVQPIRIQSDMNGQSGVGVCMYTAAFSGSPPGGITPDPTLF